MRVVDIANKFLQNVKITTELDTKDSDTSKYYTAMFTTCKTTIPDTDFSKLAPGLTKTYQIPVSPTSRPAPCPVLPCLPLLI